MGDQTEKVVAKASGIFNFINRGREYKNIELFGPYLKLYDKYNINMAFFGFWLNSVLTKSFTCPSQLPSIYIFNILLEVSNSVTYINGVLG